MRRGPRLRKSSKNAKNSWRQKVEPLFVWVATQLKRISKLQSSCDAADQQNAQKLIREPFLGSNEELEMLLKDFHRGNVGRALSPNSSLALFGAGIPDEDRMMICWACWRQHGKSWKSLILDAQAGDESAVAKLQSLSHLHVDWTFGDIELDRFKFRSDRFEGNRDHNLLLEFGLCLGLDSLTESELADCFDEMCACGQKHSAENLRKLRGRVARALERAEMTAKAAESPDVESPGNSLNS